MMNLSGMVALLGLGCLVSMPVDARTWTNDQGVEMEGELVGVKESDIVLKLSDGRQVSIPLKVLSGEDVAYVREWEQAENHHRASGEVANGEAASSGTEIVPTKEKKEKRWPGKVLIPEDFLSNIVQESPAFSVYESDHFHFEASRKLHEEERKNLVSRFEGALFVLSKLPFDLPLARRESGPYFVKVFFNADDYVKSGGKKKTRVSMTPSRLMVHLKRNSRGRSVDLDEVNPMETLSDWVSQFAGDAYWFGEGFREYMKRVPLTKNGCNFSAWSKIVSGIPRTIRRERLALPSLEKLMTHKGGIAKESERNQTRMRYGALVSVIYFLRMDGEGSGVRIGKYVDALQKGEDNPINLLLDGRSWGDLESEMVRSWKKYGVSLRFEGMDGKRDQGGKQS